MPRKIHKTVWRTIEHRLPDEFVEQIDALAEDYGMSRCAGFIFVMRCGLPIARSHLRSLKSSIAKASGDAFRRQPIRTDDLEPPQKRRRERKR